MSTFAAGQRARGTDGSHQDRYLDEHYIAEHNSRYAHSAASEHDYHGRKPTARQLDEIFRLEETRVVGQDWVVSYKGKLLERQSRHYAPARSRELVRENQAGEIAVQYRGRKLT